MTKPTGRPTGRPRKPADPAPDTSVKSTDATDAATPAPAPDGSPEIIASIAAKLLALDPGVFKTGQMYDTASENLRVALAHHKDIQKSQADAQAAARLDKVPELESTVATLTGEALASKKTITALTDENTALKLRLPSAELWDAQEAKRIEDEKTERERIATEEAQAKEQKRREAVLTRYQAAVNQDIKNEQAEQDDAAAHRVDARGVYVQFGQPGCELYNRHQAELTKRATNLRYLSYAERLIAEKEFTSERARELENSFLDAADTKARQDQHAEATRAFMENREFDPSFDYQPPIIPPEQSEHAPTRGQKVYDYGHAETLARWKREGRVK